MKLEPSLAKALAKRGLDKPTPAQEVAWPSISSGKNVLLIAPTGVGKTEAAAIPFLNKIITSNPTPISLLYITPLRALNRDMLRRLSDLGNELNIDVAVRHGDTSQKERNRQSKNPPTVLVTTPETLQVMLSGKNLRTHLSAVNAVIIDEIHELASSERGSQLSIALERLAILSDGFQRVGLSATVGTPKSIANFLGGDRDVEILSPNIPRKMDLRVVSPEPEEIDNQLVSELYWEPQRIASLRYCSSLAKEGPTLLFVNTRDTAEALGVRWKMWDENYPLQVHHGSLSKQVRVEAEESYKDGIVKTLICTSSLELGIDVGDTAIVLQYNSPKDPSRMSQRLGRSGHKIGKIAKGRLVSTTPDEILESSVIAKRTLEGNLEPSRIRKNPISALANQIISWAVCDKQLSKIDVYNAIIRAYPFRDFSTDDFNALLDFLVEVKQIRLQDDLISQGPRSRIYFHGNLSLIPDEITKSVKDVSTQKTIGRLDERFTIDLKAGDKIIFRGSPWVILDTDEDVSVAPSKSIGELPRWIGEDIPVPYSIAQEASSRLSDHNWKNLPLSKDALKSLDKYRQEIEDSGVIPSPSRATLEKHDHLIILHYPGGTRLNRTIGLLLSSLLTSRCGDSVGFQSDPYRVLLDLPRGYGLSYVENQIKELKPAVSQLLKLLIIRSNLIKPQLLFAARKMGAISPETELGHFGFIRMLEAYRDSSLFTEAVERLLFNHLDENLLESFIDDLTSGKIILQKSNPTIYGSAGLDPYKDYLKPPKPSSEIIEAVKGRLKRSTLSLVCLNCKNERKRTVSSIRITDLKCPKCKSKMIGTFHPMELERGVSNKKLLKSSSLTNMYGLKAALVMAGRGVGPETAGRILRRPSRNEGDLVRHIMDAEITFARTRRFWN